MEYFIKERIIFAVLAALLQLLITEVVAEEYGSFHDSHPPFQYTRSRFTCISQNKQVLWESIVVEVHPGASADCSTVVERSQDPEMYLSIDRCINGAVTDIDDECHHDEEFGVVFQINQTTLISNTNITFPCVNPSDVPEIIAIQLIYTCKNDETSGIHPDDDIMTSAPMLPPIPPNSGPDSSSLPPPPQPDPTMVIDHTDLNTPGNGHVVVTEAEVTSSSTKSAPSTTPDRPASPPTSTPTKDKLDEDKNPNESPSHPITYNELAVIVGPSVAAIAVLILILVLVIVLVKRKTLKLPGDLQGESLFYSRRFSTASQLSDISVSGQQMRTVP